MGKKKKDDKHSPLIALLPGAKIDNEKGKISVNVGISSETVIFNIGGVKLIYCENLAQLILTTYLKHIGVPVEELIPLLRSVIPAKGGRVY
jgi:hypothetical protein